MANVELPTGADELVESSGGVKTIIGKIRAGSHGKQYFGFVDTENQRCSCLARETQVDLM